MTAADLDRAALLRAVLDDPADDLPRLAFADWEEERGDTLRAEFIRLQLRLARHDAAQRELAQMPHAMGRHTAFGDVPPWLRGDWLGGGERHALERREENLRAGVSGHWHGLDALSPLVYTPNGGPPARGDVASVTFRRGFVESVALPLAAFMEHAALLFAAHPVALVTLAGLDCGEPDGPTGVHPGLTWWYFCDGLLSAGFPDASSHWLPAEFDDPALWPGCRHDNHSVYFRSRAAALAALSRASVRYGRSLHKLPLLEDAP